MSNHKSLSMSEPTNPSCSSSAPPHSSRTGFHSNACWLPLSAWRALRRGSSADSADALTLSTHICIVCKRPSADTPLAPADEFRSQRSSSAVRTYSNTIKLDRLTMVRAAGLTLVERVVVYSCGLDARDRWSRPSIPAPGLRESRPRHVGALLREASFILAHGPRIVTTALCSPTSPS